MSSSEKNNHYEDNEDHEAKKELATDEHRLSQIRKMFSSGSSCPSWWKRFLLFF
jgi:hypothetical protein